MGVLLGKEVDAFTVRVVDAFPLPGCPLWSLDRAYIDSMLLMLHQTNRVEGVVGWYRSHPGFNCCPSDRDVVFHRCFEELNPRAILVIVDPIKSVKGNFVINAFQPVTCAPETTSNIGSMQRKLYCLPVIEKPFFQTIAPGLHLMFYLILISHRKNDLEVNILKSMNRTVRRGFPNKDLFTLCWFPDTVESDKKNAEEMLNDVLIKYQKQVQGESDVPENPPDAEKHLAMVENLMLSNIRSIFGMMLALSFLPGDESSIYSYPSLFGCCSREVRRSSFKTGIEI
ncbi:hypothetical protein GUJ93_ZPchr0007g6061 [Zizania palustris]|uniref:MPN domain-containing protein n=1 Tax=Zizania palustris TaxID=103762 RepID=A0A8J5TGP4_ZIZPA|nr:hypothetical protein GUJ93_ZPchr0007g6061 [Zizania palustris]